MSSKIFVTKVNKICELGKIIKYVNLTSFKNLC